MVETKRLSKNFPLEGCAGSLEWEPGWRRKGVGVF